MDYSDTESEESSIIFVNDLNENSSDDDSIISSVSDQQEFDVESDDEEYDEIYQEDSLHVYSDKEDAGYYIGLAKRVSPDTLLMVNSISPIVFFKYGFERVRRYLAQYSIIAVENAKVHIMKLCILPDQTYSVILKTHWLRLVQRHWRKVYTERKRVIKGRKNIVNLRDREIYGKWPHSLNRIPILQGMISVYNKVNKLDKFHTR
jgi:hypothetical protein